LAVNHAVLAGSREVTVAFSFIGEGTVLAHKDLCPYNQNLCVCSTGCYHKKCRITFGTFFTAKLFLKAHGSEGSEWLLIQKHHQNDH
jgi:hypothetical protein